MKRSLFSLSGTTLLVLIMFFAPGSTAWAAQGGFAGPGPSVVTVEQSKSMPDDSHVTLHGNIVQHLGKDKYLFRDATGSITVEI
ncbi:MAG: NirD/YgiW/YdeI family stress tolerance protein, partial [Burkholderiaceae bacterium]|nr:NirD/YgiW/YdeI family stress tolerance protein [Burkholderiaceae bacterium]